MLAAAAAAYSTAHVAVAMALLAAAIMAALRTAARSPFRPAGRVRNGCRVPWMHLGPPLGPPPRAGLLGHLGDAAPTPTLIPSRQGGSGVTVRGSSSEATDGAPTRSGGSRNEAAARRRLFRRGDHARGARGRRQRAAAWTSQGPSTSGTHAWSQRRAFGVCCASERHGCDPFQVAEMFSVRGGAFLAPLSHPSLPCPHPPFA